MAAAVGEVLSEIHELPQFLDCIPVDQGKEKLWERELGHADVLLL